MGSLVAIAPLAAGEIPTFFLRSPRLTDAMTTYNQVRVWSATYYFTIALPEDAGQPIARVTVAQREGFENINFIADRTIAFLGTRDNRGAAIPLTAKWDSSSQTVDILLENSVPPGSSVTIGIKPTANPDYGGIYLYGVTAYPPGKNARGLYLGVGRLQFYRGGFRS